MRNNIACVFKEIADTKRTYLAQWYLDTPAIIPSDTYARWNRLQRLLYKAIWYYVGHFGEFEQIFPIPDVARRVVDICRPYPYRIGTYRPDFLIDRSGQIKICEIGARFPLNGYFMSGISEYIGTCNYPYVSYLERPEYERFLHYLFDYWGRFERLCVLKSADKPCDIKYYTPFFEALGIPVHVLSPEQIKPSSPELANCAVVNELNQYDMERLDDETLHAIAASNALNDMRTIFLIHDKRFLAVLSDAHFQSQCLEEDDIAFLRPYLIPTYTRLQNPELWHDARRQKDGWVLKHALLGKSEQVYVGCTCSEEEWEGVFASPLIEAMVLQPFIRQQRLDSTIGEHIYSDFVVGTLLCFDDCFLGPGIFRTSSFEVTNRVDDRKMAACFTDNYSGFADRFIL
ncbi:MULTISPECIES: hypothetical protein [unclassified Parabacteroides]|nr:MULTISPECIES: hypothetical protein [unclassified Parabacteroides]